MRSTTSNKLKFRAHVVRHTYIRLVSVCISICAHTLAHTGLDEIWIKITFGIMGLVWRHAELKWIEMAGVYKLLKKRKEKNQQLEWKVCKTFITYAYTTWPVCVALAQNARKPVQSVRCDMSNRYLVPTIYSNAYRDFSLFAEPSPLLAEPWDCK